MKTKDLLLLGGIGAGAYFLFFTDEGSQLMDSIGSSLSGLIDFDLDYGGGGDSAESYEYKGRSGGGRRKGIIPDDIYMPIQDLYIPDNYYKFRYVIDPHRIPSERLWDWYRKGSGILYEDYYYPPHYWWNPDYYFYWGNMYKKWYPNLSDLPGRPIRQ